MALGAVVVLALWPVDGSSGKRLPRNKDSSDADTNGIVIGSPDVHPHYRHHGITVAVTMAVQGGWCPIGIG